MQGTKGSQHFEIEVLTDLMLTRNTRVFKVALFATEPGRYLEALVCDSQRPRGELIAEYFLNTFLGCELLEKPEVATKTFVDAAEAFFNKAIQDPTARSRYHTALLAELGSNHTTIRSKAFAESHLDNTDRAPFLSALKDAGVPPAFPKHTGLVKNRIGRTRLDFDGDVSVSMPPDALNKSVSLENIADGRTRLQLEAHLESVRGAK